MLQKKCSAKGTLVRRQRIAEAPLDSNTRCQYTVISRMCCTTTRIRYWKRKSRAGERAGRDQRPTEFA